LAKAAFCLVCAVPYNPEIMREAGLNEQLVNALDDGSKALGEQNQQLEQLMVQAKAASKAVNKKMVEVRKQFHELKKKVKRNTDQSKWRKVGIMDKK
jgi:ABC-type transporter Mla subunit MlaD